MMPLMYPNISPFMCSYVLNTTTANLKKFRWVNGWKFHGSGHTFLWLSLERFYSFVIYQQRYSEVTNYKQPALVSSRLVSNNTYFIHVQIFIWITAWSGHLPQVYSRRVSNTVWSPSAHRQGKYSLPPYKHVCSYCTVSWTRMSL
jgi:hypothetical protein